MAAPEDPDIVDQIRKAASKRVRADGSGYESLGLVEAGAIAARLGRPVRHIETAALAQGIVPEKYSRNLTALSPDDQIVLARAAVAVVGVGGLGGNVTEMLARIGVGRLTLIDADRFEESNLNRQVLCTPDCLGRLKAEVASERVATVNASVTAIACALRLDDTNARSVLAGHQVVVDCLDNLPDRLVVEKACRDNGIALVSAAVAGYCGQLTVVFPGDRGLGAIYGDATGSTTGVEAHLGNLAFTVGVMAGLQCAEVINVLLHAHSPLRHRVLVMDLGDATVEVVVL